MSLKSYLFMLIIALIMVISGLQFYFIEKVRWQINEEVSNKSEALSQVALSAISEMSQSRINDNVKTISKLINEESNEQSIAQEHAIKPLRIMVKATPNRNIKLSEGLTLHTGKSTKTVTVLPKLQINTAASNSSVNTQKVNKMLIPNIEFTQFDAVLLSEKSNAYKLEFSFNNDEANFQKFVSFNPHDSSINSYFTQLRWQLLIFTFISFVLAYFLAKHISKPLSYLRKGFDALSEGKLGIQLPQSGVKELNNTIHKFNETSQRLLELQGIESKYQQQQQMAELGEVARGLAHTLRNPLNTIGLGVSQIQQASTSEQDRALIAQQIQEKISHLDNTIKTLMHLANSEVDRSAKIEIVGIINGIILEVSLAQKTNISVQASADKIFFVGAESEVRAMFHALITNAVEANNAAQHKAGIEIVLEKNNYTIKLDVIDKGTGINGINQDDLFKPHISTKSSGAGMGLFIVKRISELYYQGEVSLENTASKGCHARLTLNEPNNIAHTEAH